MRVLLSSTAGSGHFNPLVPVLEALERRNDDVLIAVPPKLEATVRATGHPFRIGSDPPETELASLWARVTTLPRAEASVIVEREIFGRLFTAAMLPTLDEACRVWRPDLVLRETCEYASLVAAERYGVMHAQIAISAAAAEAGAQELAAPALGPYGATLSDRLHAAPYLTRFPTSLDPSSFPSTMRYREGTGVEIVPLPDWWAGSELALVYVTFGSVTGGAPLATATYRVALEAVAKLEARVLFTVGHAFDPGRLGPVPANVHIEAWVPQKRVLPGTAVVVCHGGSGTTFGALAAGVPIVFTPLFADQPANARRVTAAGAGLTVGPNADSTGAPAELGPADVAPLRAAIEAVLEDNAFAKAARRISDEMRVLPDIDGVLEQLATVVARH
ncbi:MAG TPA: glycosyltransferase [Candidatus Dormibacteraeota bacterium]|nr:glycosyltransferase [Candidatus Dormibacteraeota bacterium]